MKIFQKMLIATAFLLVAACSGSEGGGQPKPSFSTSGKVTNTNLLNVKWQSETTDPDKMKSFTLTPTTSEAQMDVNGELGSGTPVKGSLALSNPNAPAGPLTADVTFEDKDIQAGQVTLELDADCKTLIVTQDKDKVTYTAQVSNRKCPVAGGNLGGGGGGAGSNAQVTVANLTAYQWGTNDRVAADQIATFSMQPSAQNPNTQMEGTIQTGDNQQFNALLLLQGSDNDSPRTVIFLIDADGNGFDQQDNQLTYTFQLSKDCVITTNEIPKTFGTLLTGGTAKCE
ncbi:MAG: hypothetical protein A3I05_08335 [Deltaproteobacteria bacterium RIFCSPLOWO2_02_FULL_44_10]|nr:MAG: hypothetical protein A3I05_08335 [Deltaproteobacteria bacterium RIFCSPLOWO2_02_FULL_44_10]